MSIEFQPWPKIARLNRDIIVTEKIDGTNSAIHFDAEGKIACQSRKRLITPGDDNFGFAQWAYGVREELFAVLGEGIHFGEWWGSGIQRGYGCEPGERYFSLFNVKRWDDQYDPEKWPASLSIVPVLYWGPFSQDAVVTCLDDLRHDGSYARFGFAKPEGVVVYHTAANEMFKVTLENDEAPKSAFTLAA